MRTVVTGGAGFIGSSLVERLVGLGHEVEVVDDLSNGKLANLEQARAIGGSRLSFHELDVRSEELVALLVARRPEVVFHLAAQADVRVSVERPLYDAEVNILGTVRVLEAARASGARRAVLAASGGTLYGEPDDLPVKESAPHLPLSPYGVSKKAAIDYLMAYRALHGLEGVALALANVYGPRQDPHGEAGVVAIFAGLLSSGRSCTIYGDGSQTRDFVYVEDVVDAFVRSAELGDGLVMNIGTGEETSVSKLYETMAELCGSAVPAIVAPARAGELSRSSLDASLARSVLGWSPHTELSDGVSAVLQEAAARLR